MLLDSNLRLIASQLDELAETPYFSAALDKFNGELRLAISSLIERLSAAPPTINIEFARAVSQYVWQLTEFLTGSTTKQIPYEMVYAISRAAAEWSPVRVLVTTAIIQEANFYFNSGHEPFYKAVEQELGIAISARPIQIKLPYIYRHKPLFCVALFHELGHYIDDVNEIVATSLLIDPIDSGPNMPGLPASADLAKLTGQDRDQAEVWVRNHRAEYFADTFAAAYVGESLQNFLGEFVPANPASASHPSTADRIKVTSDFINGVANPVVDVLQRALQQRGLSKLVKKYCEVDIKSSIDSVRPFTPSSDEELFGLFSAGWSFLMQQWSQPTGVWINLTQAERVQIINDLVEKSIRNRMIIEGWNEASN